MGGGRHTDGAKEAAAVGVTGGAFAALATSSESSHSHSSTSGRSRSSARWAAGGSAAGSSKRAAGAHPASAQNSQRNSNSNAAAAPASSSPATGVAEPTASSSALRSRLAAPPSEACGSKQQLTNSTTETPRGGARQSAAAGDAGVSGHPAAGEAQGGRRRNSSASCVSSASNEVEATCPLCMETLDETDREFFPCECGYQVGCTEAKQPATTQRQGQRKAPQKRRSCFFVCRFVFGASTTSATTSETSVQPVGGATTRRSLSLTLRNSWRRLLLAGRPQDRPGRRVQAGRLLAVPGLLLVCLCRLRESCRLARPVGRKARAGAAATGAAAVQLRSGSSGGVCTPQGQAAAAGGASGGAAGASASRGGEAAGNSTAAPSPAQLAALRDVRVIQRSLVYVIGVPPSIAKKEVSASDLCR